MQRPRTTLGMRHVALNVRDLAACEHFYTGLLGMAVEWRPDADNVYLTSGNDNLALHHADAEVAAASAQRLDHIGFFIASENEVNGWHDFLKQQGVPIMAPPVTHRDGARSFYCNDPEGMLVQIIFHPPICSWFLS